MGGGGALALALGLYLLERRVLQRVALFHRTLAATMVAAGDRLGWSWETADGYGLLVLGAGWLELGRRGAVAPRRTSETLGSLALLAGPEALDAAGPGRGTGGCGSGWGWRWRWSWPGACCGATPLGIGAAGMVVFLGQVAGEHWRDLGASVPSCWSGWGWSRPRWCWPAAARRPGRAAAGPQSRTAVRALTMPRP